MSNTIITNTNLALKEALVIMHSNCPAVRNVSRGYDSRFGGQAGGIAPGLSMRIKKPRAPTISTSAALDVQDYTEDYVDVAPSGHAQVAFSVTGIELNMELGEAMQMFIGPAAKRIATQLDVAVCGLYKDVANSTYHASGPGNTPATAAQFLNAGALLDNGNCPISDRITIINPACQASMVGALTTLTNPSADISKQYKSGAMGQGVLGFDWFMSQNIASHTIGTWDDGSVTCNGASQTGTTLNVTGTASGGVANQGDVFTAAGSNGVNPESRVSTGALQQFVVTADTTASTNTIAALPISPYIYTSGNNQTVVASPTDAGAITIAGTAGTPYPQNLVFHKDAFCLVTADLPLPTGAVIAASRQEMDGISMLMIIGYLDEQRKHYFLMDVYYGVKTLRSEWAARVWG